jgi:hypothetical protein
MKIAPEISTGITSAFQKTLRLTKIKRVIGPFKDLAFAYGSSPVHSSRMETKLLKNLAESNFGGYTLEDLKVEERQVESFHYGKSSFLTATLYLTDPEGTSNLSFHASYDPYGKVITTEFLGA